MFSIVKNQEKFYHPLNIFFYNKDSQTTNTCPRLVYIWMKSEGVLASCMKWCVDRLEATDHLSTACHILTYAHIKAFLSSVEGFCQHYIVTAITGKRSLLQLLSARHGISLKRPILQLNGSRDEVKYSVSDTKPYLSNYNQWGYLGTQARIY